jgi:hypothetical protein
LKNETNLSKFQKLEQKKYFKIWVMTSSKVRGLRCVLFGHQKKKPCLKLNKTALIAI